MSERTNPHDAPADPPRRDLICPRCGYDVSGPVSTWSDSCPVEGRCTECGLEFRWGDVFDPIRGVPPWFFEFAARRRARTLTSTIIRTLLPWHFWRRIELGFPLQRRRLLILLGVLGLVWYLVPAVLELVVRIVENMYWGYSSSIFGVLGEMLAYGTIWESVLWPLYTLRSIDGVFVLYAVANVLMPFCFVTLVSTLGAARIRPIHFVRAAAYTLIPLMVVWMAWRVLSAGARISENADLFGDTWFYWHVVGPLAYDEVMAPLYWPVWMLLSWWCVCRLYLRIRHAFWTAVLLLVMALLLMMVVMMVLSFFL